MKDPHGDVFCKCYWICHDCNLYFLDYTCCPLPGSRWPRSWRQGWQRWERWEIEAWRLLSAANRRFLWNFGFVGRLFDWNQNLRTIQIEQQMFLLFAPWQPCILCVCEGIQVSLLYCWLQVGKSANSSAERRVSPSNIPCAFQIGLKVDG